jgi:gluconate 5-dehydrogenase
MQIDLFGSFRMARAVAKKAMIPANYGRIINIASMYGLVGNMVAGSTPYHAAKGGVVNMTRALAAEWGKYNIAVNSICPGYFYTDLTVDTLNSDFFQEHAKRTIPEGRYGNEGELDGLAILLASPACSYLTGQNIAVDGGYTCI